MKPGSLAGVSSAVNQVKPLKSFMHIALDASPFDSITGVSVGLERMVVGGSLEPLLFPLHTKGEKSRHPLTSPFDPHTMYCPTIYCSTIVSAVIAGDVRPV